jgi:hypothetical protein
MAKIVKRRRGTTAEHAVFVGAIGEITIDLDKDTVVVHDNDLLGGFPLAREDLSNVDLEGKIGIAELDFPDGQPGQFLKTDGSSGLSFATVDINNSIVGGDVTGTVSNIQIAAGAVDSTEIATGAIIENRIADDAVTSPKIADNAVGMSEINIIDGSLGQVMITNGAGALSFKTSMSEIIVTPTAGQLTFSGLTYNIGRISVYLNGIKLLNGVDFVANDGTSVVFTAGVSSTDRVEFQLFV